MKFSLRSLLIFVTLIAAALGVTELAVQAHNYASFQAEQELRRANAIADVANFNNLLAELKSNCHEIGLSQQPIPVNFVERLGIAADFSDSQLPDN